MIASIKLDTSRSHRGSASDIKSNTGKLDLIYWKSLSGMKTGFRLRLTPSSLNVLRQVLTPLNHHLSSFLLKTRELATNYRTPCP